MSSPSAVTLEIVQRAIQVARVEHISKLAQLRLRLEQEYSAEEVDGALKFWAGNVAKDERIERRAEWERARWG